MWSIFFKLLLLSMAAVAHGYQGGYNYEVQPLFMNITSFNKQYFEIDGDTIIWKQTITDTMPIKVFYFFATEKYHDRYEQIDGREDFCLWLSGVHSHLTRPIYNFNMDVALGIERESCPITPAKRTIRRVSFPHNILTDRHIPCEIQNFFFDIFYADEYNPLLTVWVQFAPNLASPACG